MIDIHSYIRQQLLDQQDPSYRSFQCKLIPGVDPQTVIGVRTPALRALARKLCQTADIGSFLGALPHLYFDENNLHGLLISSMKDYDTCLTELDRFLPYVDNWATCDLIAPKVFCRHREKLLEPIARWMHSEHTYTIRFGMEMLMSLYLDEAFQTEYLAMAAEVRSEEYYVNMMTAWFFATALAKQYEAALPYMEERRLTPWVHNKAIQKAIESYRVSDEHKAYLKTLRIPGRSRNG